MMLFSSNASEIMRLYPPTLLDRLQDEEPRSPHDRAVAVDAKKMRSIVQKDIIDLINHTNINEILDKGHHRQVLTSVLNYGISGLIGTQENHRSWNLIENKLRETILCYEPRIIPESLVVCSLQENDVFTKHAILHFEIRGLIHWFPRPIDLCMTGRYDFEAEKVDLKLE
ncbi:type VI secretion system baseplate subunit TssE [Pantoea septica]|uniref:type VI secretion system baseplate subunit TssE n=1 Tax=Pantoea septica TaxID=472695 RepID=UPI0028A03DD5|nr:GPW/gp25 family protein [Pantoea septica]